MVDRDIAEFIQLYVAFEKLNVGVHRLNGGNTAQIANNLCFHDGVVANVCPDIENVHPGVQYFVKQFVVINLALAIQEQGSRQPSVTSVEVHLVVVNASLHRLDPDSSGNTSQNGEVDSASSTGNAEVAIHKYKAVNQSGFSRRC